MLVNDQVSIRAGRMSRRQEIRQLELRVQSVAGVAQVPGRPRTN